MPERPPYRPEEPEFRVRFESLPDSRHPHRNEDAWLVMPEADIYGVFDGKSNPGAGEVASAMARDLIKEEAHEFPQLLEGRNMENAMDHVLRNASEKLADYAAGKSELEGMGTTAALVKLYRTPDGYTEAVVGSVGNSRVYHLTGEGRIRPVTLDDGPVRAGRSEAEAWALQAKLANAVEPADLDLEDLKTFKLRRVITQAVGERDINPNIYTVRLLPGDVLAILSDGVTDNLSDETIKEIVQGAGPDAARVLVQAAYAKSRIPDDFRATSDDMTAIVVPIR